MGGVPSSLSGRNRFHRYFNLSDRTLPAPVLDSHLLERRLEVNQLKSHCIIWSDLCYPIKIHGGHNCDFGISADRRSIRPKDDRVAGGKYLYRSMYRRLAR
jgi:hypothetical protein